MKEMIARVGDTLKQSGIVSVCLTGEELVRCKYCKHRLECDYWLEKGDDWYCGDGERRNENA